MIPMLLLVFRVFQGQNLNVYNYQVNGFAVERWHSYTILRHLCSLLILHSKSLKQNATLIVPYPGTKLFHNTLSPFLIVRFDSAKWLFYSLILHLGGWCSIAFRRRR